MGFFRVVLFDGWEKFGKVIFEAWSYRKGVELMKRARLIYNPTAGREVVERQLPQILHCFEKAGYETSCYATDQDWSAKREAKLAAERGFDLVIAAGGDGTVHEVVNGLVEHPHPPKLAILPCGTTNDFARALHLPKNLIHASDIVAKGKTIHVDVGKFGDRYFINVAAAGKVTEVTYQAKRKMKAVMGPLAYYVKAIEKLGELHHAFPIKLKADKNEFEMEALLVIIANSVSVGGFRQLAPDADLCDGLLDVLIVPKTNITDLLQLTALAMRGKHIDSEQLIYFQTNRLDIDTQMPLKLNLDGELGGRFAGTVEILPRRLEIFVPNK